VLLQDAANDRVGDRVGIHVVLAATYLVLYLGDAHSAVSFRYRLGLTDHFCT
jgi:hypothetical protein